MMGMDYESAVYVYIHTWWSIVVPKLSISNPPQYPYIHFDMAQHAEIQKQAMDQTITASPAHNESVLAPTSEPE